jgi:hypothetical protein
MCLLFAVANIHTQKSRNAVNGRIAIVHLNGNSATSQTSVRDFWLEMYMPECRYVMDWPEFENEFCGHQLMFYGRY